MKKTTITLLFASLAFVSCKKDVTNEFIKDSISQPLVECVLSPNEPIKLYLSETAKFNQSSIAPNIPTPKSITITEDTTHDITLEYNADLECFFSEISPKAGSHYVLNIELPNKPAIYSECTVPLTPSIKDFKLYTDKLTFKEDEYSKMEAFKYSFKLSPTSTLKRYGVNITSIVEERYFSHVLIDETTVQKLIDRNEPQIFIDEIKEIYSYGHRKINQSSINCISNNVALFTTRIDPKFFPSEPNTNSALEIAYFKSLEDILPIHYYYHIDDYDRNKRKVRSYDAFFEKTTSNSNGLTGSLKHYNDDEITIYSEYHYGMRPIKSSEENIKKIINKQEANMMISYLSYSLYEYEKGVRKQAGSDDDMFPPLVPLQGNIINGVGVFGAKSTQKVPLFEFGI
ncbi:DUF4249 domain-containing protein [Halosquirtibacter xylanolyticus]|uniref:DUF4249 family protein n=1 Tax=Halosquirtibacter xylanolyticus TaxID=3374599 RepID=UPI0037489541|nr:DUF4249 domain-containing protein [Prolixibacteraceae bacterium]